MPKRVSQIVADNLAKCRASAIAAVDTYNRTGTSFRTAQFIVLITMAWTAVFHAIFHRRKIKPWHRAKADGKGKGVRYAKTDGEPRHWELSECLKQYFKEQTTPERRNLE